MLNAGLALIAIVLLVFLASPRRNDTVKYYHFMLLLFAFGAVIGIITKATS